MKLAGVTSVATVAVLAASLGSCGSSAKPATPMCLVNSDCASYKPAGLVCALGYCVSACRTSSDCPSGERCVILGNGADAGVADSGPPDAAATEKSTACQAPEVTKCHYNSDCNDPLLVCGSDGQCRNQCQTDVDCPGGMQSPPTEVCTVISHLCVDPAIDKDYDPATMELTTTDAGATNAGGATGKGGGGSGGSGAAGAHGGSGGGLGATGGAAGMACAGPQIEFANVSQGDANPLFTSAVSVRSADTLFIFYGYAGPATVPDGGADGGVAGNAVYVQMFDPVTGDKRGGVEFAFSVAAGYAFSVVDVSVAPTGEIVLLYQTGTTTSTTVQQLFAAFLSVTPGDGGAAGLNVVKTAQLESTTLGDARVIWSASDGLFVFQWKYVGAGNAWYTRVRGYSVTGAASGISKNPVPTASGTSYDPGSQDDAYLAASGPYYGLAYQHNGGGSFALNVPLLTIMDNQGYQVGSFVQLYPNGNIGNWVAVGGTTKGFVGMFTIPSAVAVTFVPLSGPGAVIVDGGALDAGDGGLPPLKMFSFSSTAGTGKVISDDTGGAGGVGAVLLESDGASFVYVISDASKPPNTEGTVLSSSNGTQAGISNYRGSFVVSLYSGPSHSAQATVSSCQ
jgi:hypothetical protein